MHNTGNPGFIRGAPVFYEALDRKVRGFVLFRLVDQEATRPEYWDQCPGETAEQFMCFQFYLALGPSRYLAHAARHCSVSYATIYAWAHGWAWADRAEMYDREQVASRAQTLAKLQADSNADWSKEQAEIFALQTALVLDELRAARKKQLNGERMKPNELARHVEILNRNRTLAAGGATDRVENTLDFANATDEDLTNFEAIRERLVQRTKGS